LQGLGLRHIRGAKKGKDSIANGIQFIQNFIPSDAGMIFPIIILHVLGLLSGLIFDCRINHTVMPDLSKSI